MTRDHPVPSSRDSGPAQSQHRSQTQPPGSKPGSPDDISLPSPAASWPIPTSRLFAIQHSVFGPDPADDRDDRDDNDDDCSAHAPQTILGPPLHYDHDHGRRRRRSPPYGTAGAGVKRSSVDDDSAAEGSDAYPALLVVTENGVDISRQTAWFPSPPDRRVLTLGGGGGVDDRSVAESDVSSSSGHLAGPAGDGRNTSRNPKRARTAEVPTARPGFQSYTPPPSGHEETHRLAPAAAVVGGGSNMQHDEHFVPQPPPPLHQLHSHNPHHSHHNHHNHHNHNPNHSHSHQAQPFIDLQQVPHDMDVFMTSAGPDLLGYHHSLSGPTSAAASFWTPSMSGMDLDFAGPGANMFDHAHHSHHQPDQRHDPHVRDDGLGPFDWSASGHMFQSPQSALASLSMAAEKEQTLPTKPPSPSRTLPVSTSAEPALDPAISFAIVAQGEDPFATSAMPHGPGHSLGLGFGRPGGGMDAGAPDGAELAAPSQLLPAHAPVGHRLGMTLTGSAGGVRRAMTLREPPSGPGVVGRDPGRPPLKTGTGTGPLSHVRPALQRSMSDAKPRRVLAKSSLPALAAVAAAAAGGRPPRHPGSAIVRPASTRSSGRISPLKLAAAERRGSLLASPPLPPPLASMAAPVEGVARPHPRASVKFTIDASGRAHALKVESVGGGPPGRDRLPGDRPGLPRADSSSDESSTDDEPIILPSRTTSFALPDTFRATTSLAGFPSSYRRSASDRSTTGSGYGGGSCSSSGGRPGSSSLSLASEPDTTTAGLDGGQASSQQQQQQQRGGDAASELRRLVETRQSQKQQPAGRYPVLSVHDQHNNNNNISNTVSPASLGDLGFTMPPSETRSGGLRVRCVCGPGRSHMVDHDGFMIKCQSCETLQHGNCVNMTARNRPNVYICAFCGDTPNARGAASRMLGSAAVLGSTAWVTMAGSGGGAGAGAGAGGLVGSPLVHKSFKAFR